MSTLIKFGFLSFALTLGSIGAESLHFKVLPWSQLSLEGKSPNHTYRTHTTTIELKSKIDSKVEKNEQDLFYRMMKAGKICRFDLSIPVSSLESGIEELDSIIHSSLKMKKHPRILFSMDRYEFLKLSTRPNLYPVKLHGTLSVAGKKKEENIWVTLTFQKNYLLIFGKHDIFMTDFGIEPPLVPLLKYPTNEKVTIRFQLYLKLTER